MDISHDQLLYERLRKSLSERYGEIVGGAELATVLGFRSADTLRKAVANNTLNLKTFPVPGRQGRFALTEEVADWLISLHEEKNKDGQETCDSST